MKKFLILTLACCLSFSTAFAAKNVSKITGRVIDKETEEALAYATVSVRDWDKSVKAVAVTAEDGSFLLENVPFGTFAIHVSYVGYKEYKKEEVEISTVEMDLGVITLESDAQMLATATITAKVPVFEHKLDKIVMNVAEAVSTQGSNALEVLRKAPGVTVDMEGNVKLNGQSVSIWIDGRPSYLSGVELEALLRATDGTTIDKIEIMAHPSAKYDAEGSGGIINIRLKKNLLKGFNGSVNGTYGAMQFDRYLQEGSAGVNLNYRSDKSNTMVNYNGSLDQMGANLISTTDMPNVNLYQDSNSDFLMESKSHTMKFAHDYFINKKHTVGAIVSSVLSGDSQDTYGDNNFTRLYQNGVLVSDQKSIIETSSDNNSITTNLNYTGIFDESKGQELTVNADYAYYDILSYNFQDNSSNGTFNLLPNEVFRQNGQQYINLFSGRVDYQQNMWKNGMFETGAKWTTTQTNNNLDREDFANQVWTPNYTYSNIFNYTEHVAAVYASFGKMFGTKWMAKVGLRGELTQAIGNWISAGESSENTYFDVFPTVFAGYTPSASWNFTASYSYRINRPGYSQLNPFRAYIDANSYVVGNPDLTPQYSQQLMASVTFKNHFNLALITAHTTDLISQIPYYDEQTAGKLFLYENFGSMRMTGAALSVSEYPIFKWMTLSLSATGLYTTNRANEDVAVGQATNDGWITQAFGQLTFMLPKDFKVEASTTLIGPIPQGYLTTEPMSLTTLGVKKTFLQNRATLTLNVNDVFRTMDVNVNYKMNGVKYFIIQDVDMQKVSLSFTFRFGQNKATRARKVGTLEETSRVGTTGGISTSTGGAGLN